MAKEFSLKRGKVLGIHQAEYVTVVSGETFDLSEDMRGATAGRAFRAT